MQEDKTGENVDINSARTSEGKYRDVRFNQASSRPAENRFRPCTQEYRDAREATQQAYVGRDTKGDSDESVVGIFDHSPPESNMGWERPMSKQSESGWGCRGQVGLSRSLFLIPPWPSNDDQATSATTRNLQMLTSNMQNLQCCGPISDPDVSAALGDVASNQGNQDQDVVCATGADQGVSDLLTNPLAAF